MEFLKEYLGEELYNQVAEAIKDKGLKLADLSKGEYVAKGKFETEVQKTQTLQQNINELTEKVKTFDGVDLEALKQSATEWENKYNNDMTNLKRDSEIEKALILAKAKNTKAIKALIDLDAVKLSDNGLTGLKEQLEKLQETDAYMFQQEEEKKPTGTKFDNPPSSTDDDKALRVAMGLE